MPEPAPFLESYLTDQDVACPSCDYNLRGLKGDICPECSQQLALRVGLAEPRQRAFIGALVGLAMGAGFQGLLTIYFLVHSLFDGFLRGRFMHYLLLTAVPFVIEAVALFLLIRMRRRFQRRSDRLKTWTVVAAWMVTLAGFVLFSFFVK